jgi:hypothetical protein
MEGGPVRAFSRKMPAFGDLLTVDQATRLVEYVRGLCQEKSWPRGELNLPRPQVTEKAFPENEAVVASTLTRNPGLAETEFVYEHRVGSRGQWEVILPFIVRQQLPGDWGRGLGDIKLAYKHVIAQSASDGAIFSLAGEMKLPTGKEDQGFGSGQTVAEAYAAFGKILPRDMFLHLQAGAERPITRSPAVAEAFWRGAFGKTYAQDRGFGRTWSPMVELLGARELTAGTRVEWDVVPQMQVSLSKRQHVLISAGYRFPVNDANQRQGAFMVYLLWDWFDGGFFSGWK